jgi:hypothetical protein
VSTVLADAIDNIRAGVAEGVIDPEDPSDVEVARVTVQADPARARALASDVRAFLEHVAEPLESSSDSDNLHSRPYHVVLAFYPVWDSAGSDRDA